MDHWRVNVEGGNAEYKDCPQPSPLVMTGSRRPLQLFTRFPQLLCHSCFTSSDGLDIVGGRRVHSRKLTAVTLQCLPRFSKSCNGAGVY